jgi:tRNA threonylcarbamoyl adenosine modification protein YeaZ
MNAVPASRGVVVALETSTRAPTVAAERAGGALELVRLAGERAHASDLLPVLDALLARLGATPRDVTRVVVGTGPGSLTGLRVGGATALGITRAAHAELVGVPSFEAAAVAVEGEHAVLVVNDARGACFDVATYAVAGRAVDRDTLCELLAPRSSTEDEVRDLAAHFRAEHGPRALVLCDRASRERFQFERLSLVVQDLAPSADHLLRLGRARAPSAAPPTPLYLREFQVRAPRRT